MVRVISKIRLFQWKISISFLVPLIYPLFLQSWILITNIQGLAVSTLSSLALMTPIEDLLIPPSAYLTDRRLCSDIYAPYMSGKRAFAVGQALPVSSTGDVRLPRVLRESTSFVIIDPLIKTQGLFRINARAMEVEILKEAYGTYFRDPYCCFRAVYCALKQVSRVICSRDMSYCLAFTRERKC